MFAEQNYKKLAFQDVIAFVAGKNSKDSFVQQYKANAQKSADYNAVIADIAHGGITIYDEKFAQSVGMTAQDFEPLRRATPDYIAEKIIPALYQVAYTRTPNNRLGGDGKTESYDRHYNIGPAAFNALVILSGVNPNSPAMKYVYDEYFFPRVTPDSRKTGLLRNESILDLIRQDSKLCQAQNAQMATKDMMK